MDYENKKLKIFNLIDIIQDRDRLQVLKDNYKEQRDKPGEPNKELYDYIIDIIDNIDNIDRKKLKPLKPLIQNQNPIIQDPVNNNSRFRIITKLASGGRRKTKRRHTKRRKSKARRKNL